MGIPSGSNEVRMSEPSIIVESPQGELDYGTVENKEKPPSCDDSVPKMIYHLGKSGHASVDNYMRGNPCNEVQIDNSINEKMEKLNKLPVELKQLYEHIGSSTQEIYIKNWTLFSLDAIIDRINIIKQDNINVMDIGMRYCGMGHCKMAFYDDVTKYIYYRADGGSSDWDRLANYENLKKYKSDPNKVGLTVGEFIKEINGDQDYESRCIF